MANRYNHYKSNSFTQMFGGIKANKSKLFFMLCLLFIMFSAGQVYSQDIAMFKPDSIKKALEAMETTIPIKIDGKLDEKIWNNVKPSPRFIQIDPAQGDAPNHDTEIKVIFNDIYLYFGVYCKDSLGKKAIRATDFKRDFNYLTHDLITLCIDGFNDKRNAMSFAVNPYGVQRDYLSFDALYYDIEWDGYWNTRTTRTDSGWVAEIAIPWKTLRYPKTDKEIQDWGFQIYRNRRKTYEITAFSEFPRSFGAARMDYAGKIKNLKPPPSKENVRIQPYFLTSYNKYQVSNSEIKPEETSFKAGGEVKWAINSNDVLDFSLNTDFAQTEVDKQINNTSRFSIFFPEKRQFFLENASLFGINIGPAGVSGGRMKIQPFFSRRIGLDNDGRPIPIDVGARYVHRSSKKNFGAMLIRQREDTISPNTNFFVGRFSENFGKQNRAGGLITAKIQPEGSNITGTFDIFLRLGESHSLNSMVSYSGTTNSGKQGISAITQYYYSTNKWKAWWTQSIVTKDYNPEMGFISRSDVIGTTPGVIRYFRGEKLPFKKWIRAFEPSVLAEFYHQASSGILLERRLTSYPLYFNLQNGGYFGYGIDEFFQHLETPFSPLGVSIVNGDYNYLQHIIYASSDPSKKIWSSAKYNWGSYFNGNIVTTDIQLFFIPIPHISIGTSFNRISFDDVGIDRISKSVDIYSFEGRFALNPRLQLMCIYQRNSQNHLNNVNLRFSWEYRPLSFVHIVFNHRDFEDELQIKQIEEQVIGKISFLKQF